MASKVKSVLQKEKECFFCKCQNNLHRHHCINGSANRRNSERRGFTVYLCAEHHTIGPDAVHRNPNGPFDGFLKELSQKYYEENIGNREEFRKEFGKSWI